MLVFYAVGDFRRVEGAQRFSSLLIAYALLLVGSLVIHSFALLVSLLTIRGSHTTAIILILVALSTYSNIFMLTGNYLQLASLSPFYASDYVYRPVSVFGLTSPAMMDTFFKHQVTHFAVFIILDLCLVAWFLLALARNIKRDPNQYDLYSPLQSFGIIAFINFVLLAFVNWQSAPLIDIQGALLTINGIVIGAVGLAQVRNRDRTEEFCAQKTMPLAHGSTSAGLLRS